MKSKWIININRVKKELGSRIEKGEYKDFPATKNRLSDILKKMNTDIELSDSDLVTLRLNGYVKIK